jgi:hypothetical protein
MDFLQRRWPALLMGVLLVTTFAAGRWLAPTHVEYRETTAKATVEVKTDTHTERHEETKAKIVYRDRTVIEYKDGTVERRDVERDADVTATARTDEDRHAHETVAVDVHTVEKVVDRPAPSWQVNALVGVDLKLRPSYGAQVERSFGPFTVGVWGMTGPVGGLSLGLKF